MQLNAYQAPTAIGQVAIDMNFYLKIIMNHCHVTAFVASSALGMALGPLLALPLSKAPTFSLGRITLCPITLAG